MLLQLLIVDTHLKVKILKRGEHIEIFLGSTYSLSVLHLCYHISPSVSSSVLPMVLMAQDRILEEELLQLGGSLLMRG